VPRLAELVDAVIGIDTHRDTHEAEIAGPAGSPIATLSINNDEAGFASLLAWIRASMLPALGWLPQSRAREATASGLRGHWPQRGSLCLSASSPAAASGAARASRIRSMRT
jgi:hypothetical protein